MDVLLDDQYGDDVSCCEGLTQERLHAQSESYRGQGGTSDEVRDQGFVPGFVEHQSGRMIRACFKDGAPAPMHTLDGLPEEWVCERDESGQTVAAIASVEAGFIRAGAFYTRAEAAAIIQSEQDLPEAC